MIPSTFFNKKNKSFIVLIATFNRIEVNHNNVIEALIIQVIH